MPRDQAHDEGSMLPMLAWDAVGIDKTSLQGKKKGDFSLSPFCRVQPGSADVFWTTSKQPAAIQ